MLFSIVMVACVHFGFASVLFPLASYKSGRYYPISNISNRFIPFFKRRGLFSEQKLGFRWSFFLLKIHDFFQVQTVCAFNDRFSSELDRSKIVNYLDTYVMMLFSKKSKVPLLLD